MECSINMECSIDMNMQHGHGMQHGHMDMDMQQGHGYTAWTWTRSTDLVMWHGPKADLLVINGGLKPRVTWG
jgi:hypothetical protein